jgi:hypothetical protein
MQNLADNPWIGAGVAFALASLVVIPEGDLLFRSSF